MFKLIKRLLNTLIASRGLGRSSMLRSDRHSKLNLEELEARDVPAYIWSPVGASVAGELWSLAANWIDSTTGNRVKQNQFSINETTVLEFTRNNNTKSIDNLPNTQVATINVQGYSGTIWVGNLGDKQSSLTVKVSLVLDTGTISGIGSSASSTNLIIASGGLFQWTGGELDRLTLSLGTSPLLSDTTTIIAGTTQKTFSRISIDNFGELTWASGDIAANTGIDYSENGPTNIVNESSGTIDIQANGAQLNPGTSLTNGHGLPSQFVLTNNGIIKKTGAGTTTLNQLKLNNQKSLSIEEGTLKILGENSQVSQTGGSTIIGQAADATLQLDNTFFLTGGTLQGGGGDVYGFFGQIVDLYKGTLIAKKLENSGGTVFVGSETVFQGATYRLGSLAVQGYYLQESNGILDVSVSTRTTLLDITANPNPVNQNGKASLAGEVIVHRSQGYHPDGVGLTSLFLQTVNGVFGTFSLKSFPDGGWVTTAGGTRKLGVEFSLDGKSVNAIVLDMGKPKASIGGETYASAKAMMDQIRTTTLN